MHFLIKTKITKLKKPSIKPIKNNHTQKRISYIQTPTFILSKKEEIAFAQSYFAIQTRKQELIEERIAYIQRTEARDRLKLSEKILSQNIYERGVNDKGFGRISSKGDQALFGGKIWCKR